MSKNNNLKETYTDPRCEVLTLATEGVIAASGDPALLPPGFEFGGPIF